MKLVRLIYSLSVFGCLAFGGEIRQDQGARPTGVSTWRQVMYLGGHPDVRTPLRKWDNTLSVSAERIELKLRNGKIIEVEPRRVVSLAFEGRRYGRDMNAVDFAVLGALYGGLGIVAGWRSYITKEHFIALEYVLPDNRPAGLLLRAHKNNYRAIEEALLSAMKVQPVPH